MKKIKLLTILTLLFVCMLSGCATKTPEDVLVVGMELAYPPFETKDAQGNATGVSADFARAFGESIGKEVRIENIAWDGLIPSLQSGKVDFVISSMTITEARQESVDFSIPYANSLLGILAHKDAQITTIEDLNQAGKKVAVKTGSTGYLYAQENLKNAEIIALADESACVTEVTQGKADGFLYDQLTIYRNWQNHSDTTDAIFIPFQNVEKWGIALQKGNTTLKQQLDTFITTYTAEGGFDALSEKYLSEEKKAFDTLGFKWFFDLD